MEYSFLILLLTVCGATYSTALSLSLYCAPQLCAEGVWDANQCKCVEGVAVCPRTFCRPNQILDSTTCQCHNQQCALSCPSPKILDSATCRCVCPICRNPRVLNQRTCQCNCITRPCLSDQIFNLNSCKCEFSDIEWF